jgi:hypothetical protein
VRVTRRGRQQCVALYPPARSRARAHALYYLTEFDISAETLTFAGECVLYRWMPQPGGNWKASNNVIVERPPDGSSRMRFRAVAAHLTPIAMHDMVVRYRTALDQHLADPPLLVPLVMLDFLCIHPFTDGHPRMARLLTQT